MEILSQNPTYQEKLTPIQSFLSGTNIFITGGTGFLGKSKLFQFAIFKLASVGNYFNDGLSTVLINKLLSSCPSIDTIYLLIRNKKGKDVHTRVEDIFHDAVSELRFRLFVNDVLSSF